MGKSLDGRSFSNVAVVFDVIVGLVPRPKCRRLFLETRKILLDLLRVSQRAFTVCILRGWGVMKS
jgi:hypothetical protein